MNPPIGSHPTMNTNDLRSRTTKAIDAFARATAKIERVADLVLRGRRTA